MHLDLSIFRYLDWKQDNNKKKEQHFMYVLKYIISIHCYNDT